MPLQKQLQPSSMDFSALSLPPFPFLQLTTPHDLFAPMPTSVYDPSTFNRSVDFAATALSEEVKKEEPGTEPTYILQEPPLFSAPRPAQTGNTKKRPTKNQPEIQHDSDYTPFESSVLPKRAAVKQKQDRNLIPNTVHQLLSFVQQQYKSRYLADRVLRKLNPRPEEYSLTRFYNFHRMLRGRVNSYVNQAALLSFTGEELDEGVYSREEQRFYCLVSRVLMRHFLRSEALLLILTSKKVRRENRLQHLSVQRYLYETMICQEL